MLIRSLKYISIAISLFYLTSCSDSSISIKCDVNELNSDRLCLFEIVNGELSLLEVKDIIPHQDIRFKLQNKSGGFYYLAADSIANKVLMELLLPNGASCKVKLNDSGASVISGINDNNHLQLLNWQKTLKEINMRLLDQPLTKETVNQSVGQAHSLYQQFIASLQCEDKFYEHWINTKAEVDYQMSLLSAYSKSRGEMAALLEEQTAYKELAGHNISSADLLKIRDGHGILYLFPDYKVRMLEERMIDSFRYCMDLFDNDTLKGLYMINYIQGMCITGRDYNALLDQFGHHIVAQDQQQILIEYKKSIEQFDEGQPAINFSYADVYGKRHSLSDYKGQIVLVDVWSTWCGPCKDELPHLEQLIEHYSATGTIAFMGVSIDNDKDKWRQYVQAKQLKGVQLICDKGHNDQLLENYRIATVPRFMLFDKEGNIVSINCPRPSNPKLKALIEEQIRKN